jgi:hypothetical protein
VKPRRAKTLAAAAGSEQTRDIRERDIAYSAQALSGSRQHIRGDIETIIPNLLPMFQMGLILSGFTTDLPAKKAPLSWSTGVSR